MDLRIVNTCNNNCLYCLESALRKKEKYISKELIFDYLLNNDDKFNITFYGGNPLLHPNLLDIIKYSKENGYQSIGILSNGHGLDKDNLNDFISHGLNSFGIYFNSFNKENHLLINGNNLPYDKLLNKLSILSKLNIYLKVIIHVNKLNILTISRDIFILKNKYNVKNFDFVNYFPFDKPFENKDLLDYDFNYYRKEIDSLFHTIGKINVNVNFLKFSKDFFGEYLNYYDYKKGILNQIGEEDLNRLNSGTIPFCYLENRCNSCFIKDNCNFYTIK